MSDGSINKKHQQETHFPHTPTRPHAHTNTPTLAKIHALLPSAQVSSLPPQSHTGAQYAFHKSEQKEKNWGVSLTTGRPVKNSCAAKPGKGY